MTSTKYETATARCLEVDITTERDNRMVEIFNFAVFITKDQKLMPGTFEAAKNLRFEPSQAEKIAALSKARMAVLSRGEECHSLARSWYTKYLQRLRQARNSTL